MGDVNLVCERGCPKAYGVRVVAGFGEGRLFDGWGVGVADVVVEGMPMVCVPSLSGSRDSEH